MEHEILKLAMERCDQAEVFAYRGEFVPVAFRNNRLDSIQRSSREVYSLRVFKDGRSGFSTSSDPGGARKLVDNAVAAAVVGDEAGFSLPESAVYPEVVMYHPGVEAITEDEMIAAGHSLVDAVRAVAPAANVDCEFRKGVYEVSIVNSCGLEHSYKKSDYGLLAAAELIEGDNLLYVYDANNRSDERVDVRKITDKISSDLVMGRTNAKFASGVYPVLFTPDAMSYLILRYMVCLEGRGVAKKISPWAGKLDEQVLSELVTIWDDPGIVGSAGIQPMDDEGVPAVKKLLIERGRPVSFVLDLVSASELGMESTGNGMRSLPLLASPPQPSVLSLTMDGGTGNVEDMVRGIGRGLVIDQLMGAWAGNLYSGEVLGNIALGYVVEGGEIVGRIKNAMVSLNAFSALAGQIMDISNERKWASGRATGFGWDSLLPHVLIDRVSVECG